MQVECESELLGSFGDVGGVVKPSLRGGFVGVRELNAVANPATRKGHESRVLPTAIGVHADQANGVRVDKDTAIRILSNLGIVTQEGPWQSCWSHPCRRGPHPS